MTRTCALPYNIQCFEVGCEWELSGSERREHIDGKKEVAD